jgi:hypothetical protein
MITYKLNRAYENELRSVNRNDGAFVISIPFATDNTDYQTFKKEVLAGAELQDADGNVMTQAEADAFIATLP